MKIAVRRRRGSPRLVQFALLALAMAGCGGVQGHRLTPEGIVPATLGPEEGEAYIRGINELGCPDVAVAVTSQSTYRVQGCGRFVVYVCFRSRIYRAPIVCDVQHRGLVAQAAPGLVAQAAPAPAAWSDAEINGMLAPVHASVVGCLAPERTAVSIPVTIAADGQVRRSGELDLGEAETACIDARLAEARLGGRPAAPRTIRIRFAREQVAAGWSNPEAAVRRAVDGRALAILACAAADALALEIRWGADGALTASLTGDLRGTPQEGCVRGIVDQLTIPAPGAEGALLHAVQR